MILVDLQKAFNTLDHTLLLQKMECFGFKQSVMKWFQSYLSKFFCDTSKYLLKCWTNKLQCSTRILPQTEAHKHSTKLDHTSADNTSIFYQDKYVKKIERVLNKEFSSLREGFIASKLSFYFGDDKTKSSCFSQMKIAPKLHGNYSLKQHSTEHSKNLDATLIIISTVNQCLVEFLKD